MLDLGAVSGLALALGDEGKLVFGPDVVVEEHKERLLHALVPVALEPGACRGSAEVAYYMDNGVYRRLDAPLLAGLPFRYELTLIPDRPIGRECMKTFGHLHSPEPQSGITWAEVCEVVLGTAHFILQTLDPAGPQATKAFYVEARAGEKVIIPPDLDHCTINPGPGPLVFSDVIALGVSGNYERFRAAHGAAYLEVVEGGQRRFIPNPAYRAVPPLVRLELSGYPELGLTAGEPLYTAFVCSRGRHWPFLTDPRRFWQAFPDLRAALGE